MSRPPLLLALCLLLALAFFFFQSLGFFHATTFAAPRRTTVGIYQLSKGDFSLRITNLGATLLSLFFPDSSGTIPSGSSFPFLSFLISLYNFIFFLVISPLLSGNWNIFFFVRDNLVLCLFFTPVMGSDGVGWGSLECEPLPFSSFDYV
jgi:hypothetical protein